MSRASRRISKRKQKEQRARDIEQHASMKEQIRSLYADMKYAEVINTLADFVSAGGRDAEVYALGAWSYYRMGDYERAGKWVDVTLTEDPRNISVRILLAHLCLHADRVNDALAVLDLILQQASALSEQETDEIRDMLAYYGKHEAEMLREEYPACWSFLQEKRAAHDEAALPAPGKGEKSVQRVLQELKKRVKQEAAETSEAPLPDEPVEERKSAGESRSLPEEAAGEADVQAEAARPLDDILADISQRQVSLAEKIQLLHSFAGAAYWQGDYAEAKALLMEALRIDEKDEATLRNLAFTLAALGDKEKAVAIAARMKRADFALLWMLQQR